MSAPSQENRSVRVWTAIAVAIGLALRLARPEVHSLWIDEGMTVLVASAPDPFALLHRDSHPPLSFLLFRAWISAFGPGDLALRLLPALVSCASLVVFAPLAHAWLGRERAPWAVGLYAVAPLLVWYAHEVRMYAFVELTALVVLWAARGAWAAPSATRWAALAAATAVATGFHYYGALAGLAVVAQAACVRSRSGLRTALAAGAGVLVWTPWLAAYLPSQRDGSWPVIARTAPRDLAELPARLVAVDLQALVDHGLTAVVWILGALALSGFVFGCARAIARRAEPELDALLAALVPLAGAYLLTAFAGGGLQPRYLTPGIPGTIACIAAGLLFARPAVLGRAACVLLMACASTLTVLQLSENRREDYRTATTEIGERWRDGDRLLLLVCVPDPYVAATVDHYLRDRPDIRASRLDAEKYLSGVDRPPSGTRVHVLWREATLCWEPMDRLARSHAILERSPARFRIHRLLTLVP